MIFLTDVKDNFDFNNFNNDISSRENNLEFDKNVTKGIKLGCDGVQSNEIKMIMW